MKKLVRGVVAALTSPEAIKAERSLAAVVVTRLLLAAGAGYGTVELAGKLIHG